MAGGKVLSVPSPLSGGGFTVGGTTEGATTTSVAGPECEPRSLKPTMNPMEKKTRAHGNAQEEDKTILRTVCDLSSRSFTIAATRTPQRKHSG